MRKNPIPDLTKLEHASIITRCVWERGESQKAALAELNRRGLWLSKDQKKAADLES